jgi:hypothetical protein
MKWKQIMLPPFLVASTAWFAIMNQLIIDDGGRVEAS